MRIRARTATTLLASAALLTQSLGASACTSLILKAKDGGVVYGRTMEFSLPLHSQALVIPRAVAFSGTGPTGEAGTGLAWTGKYAAVGLNGVGLKILVDGMNEKGLAGGLLYLPDLAKFQDVTPAEAKNSIASFEMLTYVLTSFATVAEVKAGLPKIKVSGAPQATFKGPVPVHMTLHDASGASLVVEYVGGELHMYDNPTSILTNGPAFDWHLTNLGQYVNLGASEPNNMKVGPLTISPPSTGAGLHGLPGDVLSPSRFVRAFFFARNAPQPATTKEGLTTVRHIMSSFDIAPGSVVTSADSAAGGGVTGDELTEWTVTADLKNMRYIFATYDNPSLQVIDMAKVKLDGKEPRLLPLPATPQPLPIGE